MEFDVDALTAVIVRKIEGIYGKLSVLNRLELTRLDDDGWMRDPYEWIYASANSFTVTQTIDLSTVYKVGTKIKCDQGGTTKYFYVTDVSAVFIGGTTYTTTVGITGGSDYALVNAAITNNYYSYIEAPIGFPHWFNWTPVFTGFSADPAGGIYRFTVTGRTVIVTVKMPNAGTSDATGFVMTGPFTAAAIANHTWYAPALAMDSGTWKTTPGKANISLSTNNIILYSDYATGAWTNSGDKKANFTLIYEI